MGRDVSGGVGDCWDVDCLLLVVLFSSKKFATLKKKNVDSLPGTSGSTQDIHFTVFSPCFLQNLKAFEGLVLALTGRVGMYWHYYSYWYRGCTNWYKKGIFDEA